MAVCEYLHSHGWSILFHDVKIWRTQIDIVARSPRGVLTLVEVKSQAPWMPRPQLYRLKKISTFLAGFEAVQLLLAQHDSSGIHILPVDGLTES